MAFTMPFKAMQTTTGKFNVPFKEGNVSAIDVWGDTKEQAIAASGLQNIENCVNLLNYVDNTGHLLVAEGTKLFEFPNGNYACFEAMTSGYPGLGCLAYKMSNGNYILGSQSASSMSFGAAAGNKERGGAIYFFIVYNTQYSWYNIPGTVGVYLTLNQYNNRWNLGFSPNSNVVSGANVNTWFGNSIAPDYVWRSWPKLAGNSGQFYKALPVILPEIADQITPSDNQFLDTDHFSSLPGDASIWSTYLNAQLGQEYTVAWSGNNRLTLTVTNSQSEPRDKIFTFKFYFGSTAAPFATFSEDVRIGGNEPEYICTNFLLSFMYDQTEHVAEPLFLEYYAANTSYDYRSDAYTPWSETTMQNLYTWLAASSSSPSGSGPYDTGTTDNGGTPSGTGHQDPMPNVHTPQLSGAASGLFTIYCPDDTELAQIAAFLWSDNVLDNFKKYFNNFSDNIIALYVLPYKAANMPTKAFTVGTLASATVTSVDYVTTRFVSIDMGELSVGTRWDSYLDFEPYTKFSIYLPGIGVQALSADDIICPPNDDESLPIAKGSTLKLEYVLDLMTGYIAAYVKINGQIRYQFTGKVGYSIPITGANYNSMVQAYAMATAGLIGTLATGGTAAPFAASAGAAGIINAMKPDVYRGGNASGDSSALCLEYPYLIRRRPNKPYMNEQEIYTGFPSYKTGLLSEFEGYTQVLEAHVEGISCTEAERAEILQLLKSGVII